MGDGEGWTRVAKAVSLRRAQLGFRRQEDAAAAARIGVQTWRQIEGAKQTSYTPVILAAVAETLRWPPDMLLRIAEGEEPPMESPVLEERVAALEEGLSDVRAALSELRRFLGDDTARSDPAPPGAAL